jgi:hypothetical protein
VISFQVAETHPASFEADTPLALPDGVSRRLSDNNQALYPFLKLNDLLTKTVID